MQHSTASTAVSPSLRSQPSPPSSASSAASTSHSSYTIRVSAIRYLRLQGQQAITQHAKREAVQALSKALHLIDQLPDGQSLHWNRERLAIMAQYAPSYANLVGTPLGVEVYAQLCQLCEQVQQLTEQETQQLALIHSSAGGGVRESGEVSVDVAASQTVKETFYALRGYYFSLIGSNLFHEAWKLTPRLVAIAEATGDVLMLQHAWIIVSIQGSQQGEDGKSFHYAQRIIDFEAEQQAIKPTPYSVNPFAPMDPVVWARGHLMHLSALTGDFARLELQCRETFPLVERNAEPVAYQQTIFHHCWSSWTAELPGTEIDRYWAHVKSSNYQMVSLLLEVLFSLLQADRDVTADSWKANAQRIWAKFCAGASFFLVLGAPACQLLLSAGMWQQGLTLVDRWRDISDDGKTLPFNYSDCLRFRALYLLQHAHEETDSDRSKDLVLQCLTNLQRSTHLAMELKQIVLEVKSLLTSIYVTSALLHLPVSSSDFPPSALLCPPQLPLDRFLSSCDVGESPLVSLSLLASQKLRVLELVGWMEERAAGTSLIHRSTLIPRAKKAAMAFHDAKR